MKLTENDRLILESYKNVIAGLADYLGNCYELVLHSLEDYEHSVIKIINGYHTGRTVGSPITDLALNMLDNINSKEGGPDYYSYFSRNRKNEPLKSTTIAIRGEKDRIIGLLCINFYMNTPYIDILDTMGFSITGKTMNENFLDNSSDITEIIQEAKETVRSNRSIPVSQVNKTIIALLYRQNIFKIKEAVDIVARELDISKNTVYLHLRNLEKED